MKVYISLLRGINVSGHKVIRMEELRKILTETGLQNVKTYIQSGNVIYHSPTEDTSSLSEYINQTIRKAFDFEVPVITFSLDEFKEISAGNPFAGKQDEKALHITFFSDNPTAETIQKILEKDYQPEEILIRKRAAYLLCPTGYAKTQLHNAFLEKQLKVNATTRNWRTVNELLRLAKETESNGEK